jgi:dephospho-CoA kinase
MMKTFLLGVTGGIGSGKTTVCRMLEEFGAVVFYADREARKIMTENPAVKKSVQDAFGPESYTPDNEINRTVLADKVFLDKEKVRILNSIVHPHVFLAFN